MSLKKKESTLRKNFVGIGFGPIQSGLFLLEAFESGNFSRLVVAEVDTHVVDAVHRSRGRFSINVAAADGISSHGVEDLEIYNPQVVTDQEQLVSAIAAADEVATALPSVDAYGRGSPSPAELLATGFQRRHQRNEVRQTVVYAAENHNRAAELLRAQVKLSLPPELHTAMDEQLQFVNTVIGKMSGVVIDPDQIHDVGLQPLVCAESHAILVEQFNRILIERITLPQFVRGLDVFQEKPDLLPFEEAKLYGHNAAHALMGYLAYRQGLQVMSDVRDGEILDLVEQAFLEESGTPLCRLHAGVDPLFTVAGWEEYVRDLLIRMTNPHLRDQVERVIRDPLRKLGWDDRLIGTMRQAILNGIRPQRYALGAAIALQLLNNQKKVNDVESMLKTIWSGADTSTDVYGAVIDCIREALGKVQP